MVREVTDRVQQDYVKLQQPGFASNYLDGVRSLPQSPSSLDMTPLDPIRAITGEMTFPNPILEDRAAAARDRQVIPEQLDTSRPLASHHVLNHLSKVADHFENYANKLLNAVNPNKDNKDTKDNKDSHKNNMKDASKCPFMRVANKVGFQYPKSGGGAAKPEGGSLLD